MRLAATIIVTGLIGGSAVFAETSEKILEVQDAPIELSNFNAAYTEEGRYSREGITYRLDIKNTGDQKIVAYSIGLIAFDVFNDALGRGFDGVAIEPVDAGGTTSGAWRQNPISAFMFEDWGTAFAFPKKVRFADGRLWEVDMEAIVEQLRDIEAGLSVSDITPEQ